MTRLLLEGQVTDLQQQLAVVVAYIKQYITEGEANNMSSTPRTQGTEASVTGLVRVNMLSEQQPEVDLAPTNHNEDPADGDSNLQEENDGDAW